MYKQSCVFTEAVLSFTESFRGLSMAKTSPLSLFPLVVSIFPLISPLVKVPTDIGGQLTPERLRNKSSQQASVATAKTVKLGQLVNVLISYAVGRVHVRMPQG